MARLLKSLNDPDVTTCENGHNVTDKEKSLYGRYQKSRGKVFYSCRACVSLHSREYRERNGKASKRRSLNALYASSIGDSVDFFTAENDVELKLLQRIKRANETELLEIALFVAKLIPDTEKPDQE